MIFARRSIQRFIDRISMTLPPDTIRKLVQKLNRNDRASLDFEWEVAVLFALDQLGKIDYEDSHGGKSHPDVTFRMPGQKAVGFIADIATVSDRGLEDENPTRMLEEFLRTKAKALGIPGGFQHQIAGAPIGKRYGDRKVKLAMPRRNELHAFLEKHVTPRLREIKRTDPDQARIPINEGPYQFSITYRKGAATSGGGHLSYTAAYSLTKNPIYTSLKDKARRLRQSGFDGCKGIILCDGSCHLFRSQLTGVENYTAQQIIEAFMRNNSSISFVATLWVEHPFNVFGRSESRQLRLKVIRNPAARFPLTDEMAQPLIQIPDLLPGPVNDALNAAIRIEEGKYGIGATHYGGYELSIGNSSGSIRISSRALLDLLAGKIEPSRFAQDHGFALPETGKGMNNPFKTALAQGMTIETVLVERTENEDDDWITFKFSGPDPAITPFRRSGE
jgi:hypothetical protein